MKVQTRQKFFILFVSLLSGAALVFGFIQVFKNFYKTYPKNLNTAWQNLPSMNAELEDFYQSYSKIIDLQTKDTDTDGISDYDELYIYNTSPYLKDTDSDGLDDKTELSNGYDPLCAKGQNCESVVGKSADEEVLKSLEGSFDINLNPDQAEELDLSLPNSALNFNLEQDNPLDSPESLRQFLLDNGMKQEDLDKLSDEELAQVVEEAMGE